MLSYGDCLNYATATAGAFVAFALYALITASFGLLSSIALCALLLFSIAFAGICQYLRIQRPCCTLTWRAFCTLAMMKLISVTIAKISTWKLMKTYKSRSAMRAMQEATLMRIVKASRDTVFGRDHNFSQIQGIEDYRANVPVRDYADLDKYNQLAYRGEPDVFFKGRPDCLLKTSGTTGKNKTFPINRSTGMTHVKSLLPIYYMREMFVNRCGRRLDLNKMFVPRNLPNDRTNEFGVPVGPFSKYFHTDADFYTTPTEVFKKVHDTDTGLYIHSVFGLWHDRIGEVNVIFPSNLITFIRFLSANWNSVLKDIETGQLSPGKLAIDPELLNQLNQHLTPKPERAAQLRAMFGDGQDLSGFFEKAWPDVPYLTLIRSGCFYTSYCYLKKFLGNVPTFSPFMMSTEGLFGLNFSMRTDDQPDVYHPMLSGSFVEFIPVDIDGNDLGEAKLAHELEVGCLYETVATSFNCFRLRIGDVIRVAEMDKCAPMFEISHRKSHVLSVHVEKTTEKSLQACVLLASERLDCQVVDFTATDCFLYETVSGESVGTKYYAMFVELDGDKRLTADELDIFDSTLRASSENYNLFRNECDIDKMRVAQVKQGAFAELKKRMMQLNSDISETQFKMPRVLKNGDQVRCLLQLRLE